MLPSADVRYKEEEIYLSGGVDIYKHRIAQLALYEQKTAFPLEPWLKKGKLRRNRSVSTNTWEVEKEPVLDQIVYKRLGPRYFPDPFTTVKDLWRRKGSILGQFR